MERKAKWIARLPLGRLAALMLGGAVAFFCLAMPGEVLARLLAMARLSALFPAATPPLGNGARALVAGGAGLSALLLVWGCFAFIGRPPRAPHDTDADYEPDFGVDSQAGEFEAPPRRPLLAQTELGPPLELTNPLPPLPTPEPPAPKPAMAPSAAAPLAPLPDRGPESVAALMARLESSLARRSEHPDSATVTPLKPAETMTAPPSEDSLRSALEELQRMARNVR